MPFIFRILASASKAGGAVTKLYKVGEATPTATSAIVSNVRLYNTAGTPTDVELFVRDIEGGGTQKRLARKTSVSASNVYIFNNEVTLAAGNLIEVSSSATVDCTVCGVERVP